MHRDLDTRHVVRGLPVRLVRRAPSPVPNRAADRARIGIERHVQPGRVPGIKDRRAEVPQTRRGVPVTVARRP